MPIRDYYPLKMAAEILNCSEDDLIHYAVKGDIGIGVLLGNGILLKQVIDKKGCIVEESPAGGIGSFLGLSPYCLKDIEAGHKNVEAIFNLFLNDRQEYGNTTVLKAMDMETGQPLLIKDCRLMIQHADLYKFLEDKQNIEVTSTNKALSIDKKSAYLDPNHPMFSEELNIAILAWQQILESNPARPKKGSRKKLIDDWLIKNHPKLTISAKERICTLINPDKNGGVTSSD
ncbi:MAG: hypothetical protein WAW36_12810 [Methylovulum miyakonense]|uniref:hypothetical protein n=1 Tax=Methylovulum miyakonense TaxID=645578 RepID=UPI003BB7D7D1